MSDKVRLIDAEKLKKAIELLCEDERTNMTAITYFALRDLLDTMPTIEAEHDKRWISVNDRLPDKEGKYLVCGDIHLWDIEKYRTNECIVIARFTERNEWLTSLSVKYWMLLPKLPSEDDTE